MYNVGRRIGKVGSVYWSGCTEREWLVWKGVTLDSDVRGDLEKEIVYIREHLHVSQLEGEDGEMAWARMRMSGAGRRMGDLPRVRVGRIDTSSPRSSPPLPLEISPFLPLLGQHNRPCSTIMGTGQFTYNVKMSSTKRQWSQKYDGSWALSTREKSLY